MKNKKKRGIIYAISKTISWCIMVILCVIGALLIAYIAVNKIALAKGEKQPFGLYTIISPSMTPKIQVYDVVFVVKTNPEDIQIGDILSYYSTNSYFGNTPITHRVVEKYNTGTGYTFRTRGDANPINDNEIIDEDHIVGVTKMVIPQLGRVQFFLASKFGWFTIILIPAVGVIIYDILKLFKLIKIKNKMEKLSEETNESQVVATTKKRTRKINNEE